MDFQKIEDIVVPTEQAYAPYVIRPNMRNGPWIAGGAVRHWLQGELVSSDVDVYVRSEEQQRDLNARLQSAGYVQHYATKNAITYKGNFTINTVVDIQVIIKDFHKSAEDVLETFDFAQSQLVTDGYEVYGNPLWNNDELIVDGYKPESVLKRFIKYYVYGYKVKPGTLTEWSKDKKLNYNFMNDGGGY